MATTTKAKAEAAKKTAAPTKVVAKKAAPKKPTPLFSKPQLDKIDKAVRAVDAKLADKIAPVLKDAVGTQGQTKG